MSDSRQAAHPITRAFVVLSAVVAVLLIVALYWWNVLGQTWVRVLLVIAVLFVTVLVVVIRNLEDHSGQASVWGRVFARLFRVLNRFVVWWRLPPYLGSLNLLSLRNELRQRNLHDTAPNRQPAPEWRAAYRTQRTLDGTFNSLQDPHMGSAGTRFGRNAPPDAVRFPDEAELLTPNPRQVSQRLLTRDTFVPASTLNLLAAAWIQFQNHDWFNHRRKPVADLDVPLPSGDDWFENPMRIKRTEADATVPAGQPPRYINDQTHWWDVSQIYGCDLEIQKQVRAFEDGKLKLDDDGWLPRDPRDHLQGVDQTAFNDNWWIGLSLLHNLFTWEHNAICSALRVAYPSWNDEQLFQTARLINAALVAKIHTVEWTPGILAHPALQVSMNGNWWGLLGESYRKAFGRLSDSEALSGILGSPTHHHTAPYYLTEEFVSVYRLHPLIPDDYTFRSAHTHQVVEQTTFAQIMGNATRPFRQRQSKADLFYSFGVMHPGALTLHNFPRALQEFERIPKSDDPQARGERLDLATIDILRDRERGVPRYNAFRRMIGKAPVKSFRKLTDNPDWAREMEEVYDGDIEKVDLMVGLFAEPLPPGFGFSDTAFRVFILMASRRLKSDRFFTEDFTPQVYTPLGIDWVNQNNMRTVLLRHIPELGPALQRSTNAFAPWTRAQ